MHDWGHREKARDFFPVVVLLEISKIPLLYFLFLNCYSHYLILNTFYVTMVASAVFITDLQGKAIISRNYRGDVPLTKVIERFAKYLVEVDDEAKKPVFHVDVNGDVQSDEDVGATGTGGEHFVYVSVSTE
jgi:hypothetical protein